MDDTGPEDQDRSGSTENRRRSRWLAAALVGAAAPTALVPAAHAAAPSAVHGAVPAATPAATRSAGPGGTTVTVAPGDTVGAIAARTGSSVEAIVEANGLDARASIVAGRRLQVPAASAPRAAAPAAPAERTVVRGDTLGAISAATGVSVGDLREANGLSADGFIREGQVLRLGTGGPSSGTAAPSAPRAGYTVQAGDTLSQIAAGAGTTVAALVAANDLDATGFIVEGQVLDLGAPRAATAPAAAPASASSARAGSVEEAVAANRATIAGVRAPSRDAMREIVRSTAVRLGVDPSLALAVAYQESGFNMAVVSHANAVGAMQVIPSSGEWASDLVGRDLDLFDPQDNATAGVVILRTLMAANPPDVAIASYYQGQASVRSRGMYDDTRRYVANVQTLQARFR